MDDLLRRFVEALARGEPKDLEGLRVSEQEYQDLIVPGNVRPGEPPQILSAEASEYFFEVMNTKSAYHRDALLKRFRGKKLSIRKVHFEKGTQEYAGHRAYKRLALTVVDAQDGVEEIHTGSVIERDGQFKFMSFIRD